MYSTCIACTKSLGTNDVIETLPIGRRVAFDSAQGRLWVICSGCGKWNLVPFETRLETIDVCERIFAETPTRFSTDNIGLARIPEGLELVRIGAPQRPEFASWRYGTEYRRRRQRAYATSALAMVGGGAGYAGIHLLAFGSIATIPVHGVLTGFLGFCSVTQGSSWAHTYLNSRRMKVKTTHPESTKALTLRASGVGQASILSKNGELILQVPTSFFSGNVVKFRGQVAEALIQRLLGRVNLLAGSKRDLNGAVEKVPELLKNQDRSLLDSVYHGARQGRSFLKTREVLNPGYSGPSYLRAVPAAHRLALEMVSNESDERRWLTGELALLERQWKEAEALAGIADSLAMPDDANGTAQ